MTAPIRDDGKGVSIEGLAALDRKLKQFEPKIGRKKAAAALRKAMRPVRDEVKRLTPVDTGNAKRLVSVFALQAKGKFPAAGFVGWRFAKLHRRKGDDPFYIRWIEFGKDKEHQAHPVRPLRRGADRTLTVNGPAMQVLKRELAAAVAEVAAEK